MFVVLLSIGKEHLSILYTGTVCIRLNKLVEDVGSVFFDFNVEQSGGSQR